MTDEPEFRRVNPAGLMRVTVTDGGEEVATVWTSGFSVHRGEKPVDYEVRL